MQYAFKDKHSTVMCSLVLKETIRYYMNNESDVYGCFIDATKAFDRVRYDKLFTLLIKRGLPPIVLRALLDMYQRQQMRTIWKGESSRLFSTSNGIRQGGVISPVLFCVYMDELLRTLESKGHGCWIGQHYYGGSGFADDLTLLNPSVNGMREMVKICDEFGDEYSVAYNPTKTVCVLFSKKKKKKTPDISLNGVKLKWVDSVKHLGNYIDSDLRERTEIRRKRSDLVGRVNSMVISLGNSRDEIIRKVFNSQCAHFYGAQAWCYEDNCVHDFQTMWNRCVRRIFKLPYMTHTRFLPHLLGICSAMDQIYCRFLNMIKGMRESANRRVRYITRLAEANPRSIIGSNLRLIARKVNVDLNNIVEMGQVQLKFSYINNCTDEDTITLDFINELRDSMSYRCDLNIEGFSQNEIHDIFEHICTN